MIQDNDSVPSNPPPENEHVTETTPNNTKCNNRKAKSIILCISIILVLSALLLTMAAIFFNDASNNSTRNLLNQVQTNQEEQTSELKRLEDALNQVMRINQQLTTKVEQSEQRIQHLLKEQHYQTSDWQLQKVRYYLELAQVNTYWTDNNDATIALLNQADLILADVDDPKLNTVRQVLAQDLMTLQKIPDINPHLLLQKLQTVQGQIDLLNKSPAQQIPSSLAISPQPKTWRDKLLSNLKQLKDLVVIHHYNADTVMAQLTPSYLAMSRDSIRLNLQEAKIAILNRQSTLYQLALDAAIHNIEQCFESKNLETTDILQKLRALRAISIERPQPIIINALKALDTAIQSSKPLTIPHPTETKL